MIFASDRRNAVWQGDAGSATLTTIVPAPQTWNLYRSVKAFAFAPDGQSLVCDYCTRHQAVGFSRQSANEKDFITAMATARGHGKPLNEQVFHCEGCGSEFILPPKQLSANCIYCDSPHVVNWKNTKDLLAPDGVLPHQFNQQQATKFLVKWVE